MASLERRSASSSRRVTFSTHSSPEFERTGSKRREREREREIEFEVVQTPVFFFFPLAFALLLLYDVVLSFLAFSPFFLRNDRLNREVSGRENHDEKAQITKCTDEIVGRFLGER